jgi:hypothetical protein
MSMGFVPGSVPRLSAAAVPPPRPVRPRPSGDDSGGGDNTAPRSTARSVMTKVAPAGRLDATWGTVGRRASCPSALLTLALVAAAAGAAQLGAGVWLLTKPASGESVRDISLLRLSASVARGNEAACSYAAAEPGCGGAATTDPSCTGLDVAQLLLDNQSGSALGATQVAHTMVVSTAVWSADRGRSVARIAVRTLALVVGTIHALSACNYGVLAWRASKEVFRGDAARLHASTIARAFGALLLAGAVQVQGSWVGALQILVVQVGSARLGAAAHVSAESSRVAPASLFAWTAVGLAVVATLPTYEGLRAQAPLLCEGATTLADLYRCDRETCYERAARRRWFVVGGSALLLLYPLVTLVHLFATDQRFGVSRLRAGSVGTWIVAPLAFVPWCMLSLATTAFQALAGALAFAVHAAPPEDTVPIRTRVRALVGTAVAQCAVDTAVVWYLVAYFENLV